MLLIAGKMKSFVKFHLLTHVDFMGLNFFAQGF